MQVTKQQSQNECGVCVINSYVQHFYKHSDKTKILNSANINENGLSVFDFENLGAKFGLFIESYQCEWAEFCDLKNNTYYALLVNKGANMHYLIVYKTKKYLEVYDSLSGKYQTTYKEFEKDFAGIIFQITKSKTKIKYNKKKIDLQSIDLKYLLINLLIHFLIIGLSTLFANLFNWILNISVYSKSIQNLIKLALIFCLITIMNVIFNYILKQYSLIRFKQNFRYLAFKFIYSIRNKDNNWKNKIEFKQLFLIDSAILTICNFLTIDIPTLITDCFMVLISIIILSVTDPTFLIFCLADMLINIFIGIISYGFKQKNLKQIIKNSNFNNDVSRNIISVFEHEENAELLDYYLDEYKDNFFEFEKVYTLKAVFDNNTNLFETLFNNLIYILIICTGAYFLINDSMDIGKLTFIVSLLSMFNSSTYNICQFWLKSNEYSKMSDIYWSFVDIGNIVKDSSLKSINDIKTINFNDGKHSMAAKRLDLFKSSELFSLENFKGINNNLSQNKNFFKQRYIKINPDSKIPVNYINKYLCKNSEEVGQILKFFKIDLTKNIYSLKQQQILNLIFCCLQKDKIICLNNSFNCFEKEQVDFVKNIVKNKVSENNFVFFCE